MTTQSTSFNDQLTALQEATNTTDAQCAEHLGVPIYTYRHWRKGDRTPTGTAVRLVNVLLMLRTFAPDLFAVLCPTPAPEKVTLEIEATEGVGS